MVAGVKFDSTIGAFAAKLERSFGSVVGPALFQAAELVAGEVRREIASWTSRTQSRKTGALADSFRPSMVRNEDNEIEVGVYSRLPYARIHETGGVITPKSSSALAVPLTNAAQRVGPRQFPGLFLVKGPRAAVLAAKTGKGAFEPQYALVKSVTITPKHYISNAAARALPIVQPRIQKAIHDAITRSST